MKFQPFGARILVMPSEAVTRTESGLVIPERAQKIPSHGKVISIGRGDYDQSSTPMSEFVWPDGKPVLPKVNDTVWYNKYSGTDIRIDGENYVLLHVSDLIGTEE